MCMFIRTYVYIHTICDICFSTAKILNSFESSLELLKIYDYQKNTSNYQKFTKSQDFAQKKKLKI